MKRTALLFAVAIVFASLLYGQHELQPLRLTLREAIVMGLKSNLGVQVAGTQVSEAEGTSERRRSLLLPHVAADHVTSLQNRNLQAFGFALPGAPVTVGPLSNYDYRVFGSQAIFDLQAIHAYRASGRFWEAARLNYQDARDQVVRQTAGLYLNVQSAAAQLQAAEARTATSRSLVQLAEDQRQNGLATAMDVLRAQLQWKRDEQAVLLARNSYQTSLLALARYLGLRPGTQIEAAEPLALHQVAIPAVEEALPAALKARPDYLALRTQRDALLEQQKASRARYLPKLSIDGNYGVLGRSYGTMPGTGAIEATLSVSVFDRDREGEQKEIASRIQRVDDQLADLERGIEQDLRKALLDLDTTIQAAAVAQSALDLAHKELELARDRFKNGLTDNLEVVTAQSALQAAEDDSIASLARHEDAVMALVRALGATEQTYNQYLGDRAEVPTNKEVPRP